MAASATFGCDTCGTLAGPMMVCEKCKVAHYCSVKCQSAHWPRHKQTCTPPERSPWLHERWPTVGDERHGKACDSPVFTFADEAEARAVAERLIQSKAVMRAYWEKAAEHVAAQEGREFDMGEADAEFQAWEKAYWKLLTPRARARIEKKVPEPMRAMMWLQMLK